MAVPNPQQYKGAKGGAPIEKMGQTVSAFGSNPSINARVPEPKERTK